jgi:hypothetical protein
MTATYVTLLASSISKDGSLREEEMPIARALARTGVVVAAIAILVPVGSAAGAVAATPVPVDSVNYTVSVQAPPDEHGTQSFNDCRFILESLLYEMTPVRQGACALAATIRSPAAITSCTAILIATDVHAAVAGSACVAAIA